MTDKGSLQFVGLDFLQWWIQRVTTLTEIKAGADELPKEQKEQLLAFLAAKLGRKLDVIDMASSSGSVRRAGLHAGAWEVAQDPDAALLDEFWLGRDT